MAGRMETTKLADLVGSLSAHEQDAVRAFVEYLRAGKPPEHESPFLKAVDEFVAEHPELLRKLAE
jgi:hypothetical protein